jgi:hypothetical protein
MTPIREMKVIGQGTRTAKRMKAEWLRGKVKSSARKLAQKRAARQDRTARKNWKQSA